MKAKIIETIASIIILIAIGAAVYGVYVYAGLFWYILVGGIILSVVGGIIGVLIATLSGNDNDNE